MSKEVRVAELPACDLCGAEAHYDVKTKAGPWAYLCEKCFDRPMGSAYSRDQLGTGRGQRLIVVEGR